MEEKQVKSWLGENRSRMLDDLCRFVEIPSVSNDRENVRRALDFILELGASMGFHAEALLDGQAGVIEAGGGDEVLGILAHVDVVDAGDRSVWRTEPFQAVVRDGSVYGRGTLDDKGAIIASLYAMKAAAECGGPFRKKVQLILGTQEEVDWTDMRAYVKKYPLPDYGFTPDGEFPICNIEKGGVDVDLMFPLGEEDAACEQTGRGFRLISLEAGTAQNIVPGSCTAVLEEMETKIRREVRTVGKAVHSCQPEKGENAIFLMARELRKRERDGLAPEDSQLLRLLYMVDEKFGDLYGKALGMESGSEYYNGEFVHRNVFSPTIFRTEGGEARVHINVRFPYGTDPREILEGLRRTAESCGGRLENQSVLPAVYVSRERPFLKACAQAYEEVTGTENEFVLAYGGSYAKAMPNVVSWGPIFPGEEDTCHQENEYISIESLMANAQIFALTIEKIACSEESFR
ncbi:Sapep family Mn(2+)-dependent dipeptidase [Bacilliculturomica massiliensis]|uniref:Sapep family Mn(2+)-dependent dipeptidase n=1 Tax=Bacilliculturomica massiliensis TaxID=1917867 RepID=UPI001031E17D|nr:Sapep family Mn(2+)-dependent dipeptidase [Bacilliculturomica massiliensis]